jgi:hypothetical protein
MLENSTQRQPLSCGVVAPSLPGNILAEVCEFEAFGPGADDTEGQNPPEEVAAEESSISASFRRWTSPDDGWGKDPSIPRHDLAKMPMGMPVTVSELANFLMHACDGPPPAPAEEPPVESSFWASARSEPTPANTGSSQDDIFDWTLAQWRAHCLKACADQDRSAQEDASSQATLHGRWTGGSISGNILVWTDGTTATLKILAPKKFTVKAGDQTLDAELEDDGKLHWADGDVWEKDLTGNKLQYEPFFMPQQQYLKPKSFLSRKDGENTDDAETGAIEDCPLMPSPVLVHRVASATPRPILCTDDQEASLLKAVTLLLAYPELDAVPIVSPARCTVVAHLTLGYILAFVMGRLRGNELEALRELLIAGGVDPGGTRLIQRCFSEDACGEKERWAERKHAEASRPFVWVLRRSQPMRDLLNFFATTTHDCVPIVEDGSDSAVGGGILGLLSRRDLLHFLDLAMRSARRRQDRVLDDDFDEAPAADPRQAEAEGEAENVTFDAAASVEVILNTVRRHRHQQEAQGDDVAEGRRRQGTDDTAAENDGAWFGAGLVYQQELTLRAVILQLLLAENRKLLFVEANGDSAPRIRRLVSVGDAWRLLIGDLDKIVEGHLRCAQVSDDDLPEGEAQA